LPVEPRKAFEKYRGVTRVETEKHLSHVVVPLPPTGENLRRIFSAISDANIALFLIKLHETAVHMAFSDWEAAKVVQVAGTLCCEPRVVSACSLVTVVAADMRSLHGIMARIIRSLYDKNVEILEIDDAYDSVSCLIKDEQHDSSVAALREEFHLEE